MRIIDRYVLRHIIIGYVFILLVFTGLFFIADLFTNLADILKAKTPLTILAKYYLYMLPLIFKWVSPYSLLVSVLYTFGELNKNNEIISIRTAGISIFRFAFPAAFLSLLISFFALFVQENILMASQKQVDDIKIQFIKKNLPLAPEENDISFSSANSIFFVRKLSLKDKTLQEATIFKEDGKGNIIKKIICKNIVYENGKWIGYDTMEYTLDQGGKIIDKPNFFQQTNIELAEKPQEIVFKKSLFP
jgi:lipopolysaccharide export system permease protein